MKEVFFSATRQALFNITSTFDIVWPTAVGLWNLRCLVSGVKHEYPEITEAQLAAKFSQGSGIRGVNYKRAFVEYSWEKQQSDFAWILLNSTIPIFEGWLEEIKQNVFTSLKIKEMQFPIRIQSEVNRLTVNESATLKGCFYSKYCGKRERCYSHIDALLYCYRVFKEARNCYMHNAGKVNSNLVNTYNDFLPYNNTTDLCVSEVPEFNAPVLNEPVSISLRGVVGFSYILIKIIVSLDTELLRSVEAEAEFLRRYKETHVDKQGHFIHRTLKPDIQKAYGQISRYVNKCGFITPQRADLMMQFLLANQLVSR